MIFFERQKRQIAFNPLRPQYVEKKRNEIHTAESTQNTRNYFSRRMDTEPVQCRKHCNRSKDDRDCQTYFKTDSQRFICLVNADGIRLIVFQHIGKKFVNKNRRCYIENKCNQ